MARMYDQFLDCVIYLYPTERHATKKMMVGASGFLIREKSHYFAVTCAHVIEDKESPAYVVRLNTHEGQFQTVLLTKHDWVCSKEDDLAVALIDWQPDLFKYASV